MKTPLLILAIAAGAALTSTSVQAHGPRDADFATLDANGDGQITMEEIAAHGAARFANADTNGDGALSSEELTAQIAARADDRAARMAERMLSRLDANDDGVLQLEEAQARGGDRIAMRFERADTNEDGAISAEEFEAAAEDRRGRGGKGKGHRPDRG